MKQKCTVDKKAIVCSRISCKGCGWGEGEMKWRKTLLAENGLTECEDGKRRLFVGSKEQTDEEV